MHHITGEILGHTVNIDTLYFTWACMAVILLTSIFLVAGASEDTQKFGVRQFMAEGIYDFIRGVCRGQIGKRGDNFVFFVGSIFVLVLVTYYAGLIPWKMGSLFEWWPQIVEHSTEHGHHAVHHHPWHGASPCADINVTAGMAIVVIFTYFFTGLAIGGWDYFQIYLPINFGKKGISLNLMCAIELLDIVVRPLTLSLRLFANTFAGEILLVTFIGLVWYIIPAGVVAFELFVGVLQAFLFAMLTCVYIGTAVQHAEHH